MIKLRTTIICLVEVGLAVAMLYYPQAWNILKMITIFMMITAPFVVFATYKGDSPKMSLYRQIIVCLSSLAIAGIISWEGHLFLGMYWLWSALWAIIINFLVDLQDKPKTCEHCNDSQRLANVKEWQKQDMTPPDWAGFDAILHGACPENCNEK